MNFLILSRLPKIYSSQRLVEEIRNRGHEVFLENPESRCETLFESLLEKTSIDILIPRLGNFRYEESLMNLTYLQTHAKIKWTLNGLPYFHQARHKKLALQILAALPQPQLFAQVKSFPVVVKDCISSQGEGVFLCKNPAELKNCLNKLQGRELLFQEFISESQGHDIRVFIVGSQVVAAMERISKDPEMEFRSNLSLGGLARSTSLSKEEEELCISAVQKLGLSYAGVDFVRSHRGPLLLECNPCPGFEGIEKISGINIAQKVVLYAESLNEVET
ncbi:MAG: ATP-grasp domain-containing protein [Pseudobdellovibrionaceae bacterium]